MYRITRNTALAAIALAAAQAPAYAVDTGIDWLKISGFGTFAATRANIDESSGAYFNPSVNSTRGAQDSWDLGVDSKAGVQATALINPQFSATVQVIDRKDYEGSYRPVVEWANLKFDATPDIAVRVGRVGLPAFLISDYINVGYSQPWVRAPLEAYRLAPPSHLDGADATFRFHAGDTTISLQPAFGRSHQKIQTAPDGGGIVADLKSKNIVAVNMALENGPWTARYGNVRTTTDISVPGFTSQAKDNFSELGLIYDKNNWLAQGEYIWRTGNNDVKQKMGYATLGYRFGTVMPSLTVSRFREQTPGSSLTTQNTISPAVRWDFYKNMALKVQWDHITRPDSTSVSTGPFRPPTDVYTGLFNTNADSAFAGDNKSVNVVTLALDFVF